jgi:hypothetical protein
MWTNNLYYAQIETCVYGVEPLEHLWSRMAGDVVLSKQNASLSNVK